MKTVEKEVHYEVVNNDHPSVERIKAMEKDIETGKQNEKVYSDAITYGKNCISQYEEFCQTIENELNDINWNILLICGDSGSGKSTLIKVLAGLVAPDSGNRAVQKDSRIAYLPQSGLTHHGSTLLEEADKAFNSSSVAKQLPIKISSITRVASKCLACTSIGKSRCNSQVGKPAFTGQGPKVSWLWLDTNAAKRKPTFCQWALNSWNFSHPSPVKRCG